MRPKLLKPGMQVRMDGRLMTFVRRFPAQCGRGAENIFQCADYVGLYGPDDRGITRASDHHVSRHCTKEGK